MDNKKVSDEEKIKSAYALNLCTVSISQIVESNDLNILEQEYDAILNNLNLEKIIKNDALLNVLKQILDTITYFKMEDIEKKIIDEEYQQQMKNAIWSSVPNFGLLVAGGDPITMAVSLASQVGIGYMNYRKNKNSTSWEKQKKYMKLQQAALEQLNELRRELFTTAWALAEEYNFPDEYRLTEKQIKQYNAIIDDNSNLIQKYERLDFVKNNFKAYPPFWYFYGSCANSIYNKKDEYELSPESEEFYRNKAKECFEEYEKLDVFNILRENQITASFALEYAELLIREDKEKNKDKIRGLLKKASKMAPNSYDVQELCIMDYLFINEKDDAANLLNFLVNEGYNSDVNAQLLSSILVENKDYVRYDLLKNRVNPAFLFPMPENGDVTEELNNKFITQQKKLLQEKYSAVIEEIFEKYSKDWNRIFSTFDSSEYPVEFFGTDKKARNKRNKEAIKVFNNPYSKEVYIDRLKNSSLTLDMLDVLNHSVNSLMNLSCVADNADGIGKYIVQTVKNNVGSNNDKINILIEHIKKDEFTLEDYNNFGKLNLSSLYGSSLQKIKLASKVFVEKLDDANIIVEDGKLRKLCYDLGIENPVILLEKKKEPKSENESNDYFTPAIFGVKTVIEARNSDEMNTIYSLIADEIKKINLEKTTLSFIQKEDFVNYFTNPVFDGKQKLKKDALVVLKDNSNKKARDLIFTKDGIVVVSNGKVKFPTLYSDLRLDKKGRVYFYNTNIFADDKKISYEGLDSKILYDFAKKLESSLSKNLGDLIQYEEIINAQILNEWFNEQLENIPGHFEKGIAFLKELHLKEFSIKDEDELFETEKFIIQYIHEKEKGYYIASRILEFESIETNLETKLRSFGGTISIG